MSNAVAKFDVAPFKFKGTLLLSTTTGPAGIFNADLGGYAGPMMVEVTVGSYTDEATGKTAQMGSMMYELPSAMRQAMSRLP